MTGSKAQGTGSDRLLPVRILVRIANGFVNVVIILIFAVLIGYGVFSIWDNNRILDQASAKAYESYKPAAEKSSLSFTQLQAMNTDVLGWITIYGTGIDYPLVQGENNDEYINRDIDGNFKLSGSIFLESSNAPDFSDFNTIIYGHHMEKDKMFGDLDKFTDQSYFNSHEYGSIYYEGKLRGLQIFAMAQADAYDFTLYDPHVGTSQAAKKAYLDVVFDRASYARRQAAGTDDHIVMLSTCADSTNGRYVVFARITDSVPDDPFAEDAAPSVVRTVTANGTLIWYLVAAAFLAGITILVLVILRKRKKERGRADRYLAFPLQKKLYKR